MSIATIDVSHSNRQYTHTQASTIDRSTTKRQTTQQHLLDVGEAGADRLGHLDAVAGAVRPVGRRQPEQIGTWRVFSLIVD
jgi:hypothetical protein